MIDKITHHALTSFPGVHDEEALTALELMGRMGAKVNETVETVNTFTEKVDETVENLPGMVSDEVEKKTGTELEKLYAENDRIIQNLPEGGANVRPGAVDNGSIYSGMLGTDLLELRQNHYIVMAGKWTGGDGYYDSETLEFIPHDGYGASAFIPVTYGQYFRIQTYIFGNQVHPVVLLDSNKRVLEVRGTVGNGTWDASTHNIAIDRGDAAYMQVICGKGQIQNMRVEYFTFKDFSFHEANLATRTHWHMHAKKRTDTVTDRAQIKCWFKLPEEFTEEDTFSVSFYMAKYYNMNTEGITMRLFGCVDDETYAFQLPETASGYSFLRSRTLDCVDLHIPQQTPAGEPVTHLCLFMDFIPLDGEKYMDVWVLPPVLKRMEDGVEINPANPSLHGALYTDTLNIVRPGAGLAGAHRKKLLGVGDSLMKGNTLEKRFSWLNIAGGALDMEVRNEGLNGSSLATPQTASDIESVESRLPGLLASVNPDYVVIQGGANDKRINIPLARFREGVQNIVRTIRTTRPGCKILMCTNWYRTTSANDIGVYDWEYVQAMLEECESLHVPCVDNYTTGLNILAEGVKEWADEGLVSTGTANIHFSRAANAWIAEKYINAIMAL